MLILVRQSLSFRGCEINLVMPATNATSERSFSALKRVKTYMLLHVHKELTDKLDLIACANDFVS